MLLVYEGIDALGADLASLAADDLTDALLLLVLSSRVELACARPVMILTEKGRGEKRWDALTQQFTDHSERQRMQYLGSLTEAGQSDGRQEALGWERSRIVCTTADLVRNRKVFGGLRLNSVRPFDLIFVAESLDRSSMKLRAKLLLVHSFVTVPVAAQHAMPPAPSPAPAPPLPAPPPPPPPPPAPPPPPPPPPPKPPKLPQSPSSTDSPKPPERKKRRLAQTAEEREEQRKRASARQDEEGRELDCGINAARLYDKSVHEDGGCALQELEDMYAAWCEAQQERGAPHVPASVASWLADTSVGTRQQRAARAFMGKSSRDELVVLLQSGRADDGARDLHLVHWRRHMYRCIIDDKLIGGGGEAVHEDAVELTVRRWLQALRSSDVLRSIVDGQATVTAETLQVEVAGTPLYDRGKLKHRAHLAAESNAPGKQVRLAPRHYLPG